jgi:hypothetical protein
MRSARHLPDDRREPGSAAPEVATPATPEPLPHSPASVLALQRTAGNRAVSALIARNGPPTPAPAPGVTPPSPPVPKTDEQLFDDAVKAGDWAKAAELIVKLPKPVAKLPPLTVDQLRLLQDAMIRAGSALGGTGSVVQMAIGAELVAKGVSATKTAAGAAFGKLETKVVEKTNGDKAAGTGYAYKIEITFLPDTAVIDADEIAFIQTVRLVDTATGANKDPEETNKKRQTATATSVDRLGGREQGWYGMTDAGGGGATLRPWKKTDPTKPAFMMDRPSWSVPNTTWEFEASVVCRAGTDVGKVYATVTWGFSVDADLKIVEKNRVVTNKQSEEFTKAVEKWNAQAAGAEADRNAPGQKSLPALK